MLGTLLAEKLAELFAQSNIPAIQDFNITTHECLSACADPIALSFRANGKAAYLFAGIDAHQDANDILEFAKLYVASSDGWIEDARPAGRLRHCLRGRIPAQMASGSITEQ